MSVISEIAPARVGLIGAGAIGGAHAEAAAGLDGAVLVAIADLDSDRAAALATKHGAEVFDIEKMADPERLDLVVVAAPPVAHPALVAPLLRGGVPVLCEKPLAMSPGEARALADLAARTGTPLTMAAKFRFVADVERARWLVETGLLGQLLKIEVSFASRVDMTSRWNADPAVSGGGVLIDNATHALDLVRHLAGEIVEVQAMSGRRGQPLHVEDSATLLARTAQGALAQVDVTWSFRRLASTYLALYGTRGTVEIGWQGGQAITAASPEPYEFGTGYCKIDSLRTNLAAVLAALATDRPLPVTAADAVAVAEAIDAGYVSLHGGGWAPVRVA